MVGPLSLYRCHALGVEQNHLLYVEEKEVKNSEAHTYGSYGSFDYGSGDGGYGCTGVRRRGPQQPWKFGEVQPQQQSLPGTQ
jgi:hypothetical protein